MRRTYRRKKYKPDKTQYRANERIRIPEVQVIDGEGAMLGVMPTLKAIELAQEAGFDLVEVNPKAEPPLCKFLDYGKVQYEREKLKQKQKAQTKKIDTKGIRISLRISDHDRDVRIGQAEKFLEKGHRVKVELILRGREKAYTRQAIDQVIQFVTLLRERIKDGEMVLESPAKREGHAVTALMSKKNNN
jgi:translation initiation factor IF-3